jgi:hypothetical protein
MREGCAVESAAAEINYDTESDSRGRRDPMRYIDDPDYWWYRAQELRTKAVGAREFEARRALIEAADACERQSRRLEAQVAPLPD